MNSKSTNFQNVLTRLDAVLKYIDIPEIVCQRLYKPMRSLILTVPVEMESGEIKCFTGYRVRYNAARGPTKG